MEKLHGVVERVTYANEEKGYSVLKVKCQDCDELIPVVGDMVSVNVGTVITFSGKWKCNSKYGRQFEVSSWEESVPDSMHEMEKYLASGLKGIGPQFAKLIVEHFKDRTIKVLDTNPDLLLEVEKIGRKRVETIKRAWAEQKGIKNIARFLREHGVSIAFGHLIYKSYGNASIEIIRENPYRLTADIWGISFKTADVIAAKLGVEKESFQRCRSGIFYVLGQYSNDGHCYAPFATLMQKCVEMLGIKETAIAISASRLIREKELILEQDKIFLPSFFYAEAGVAQRVKALMEVPNTNVIPDIDTALAKIQRDSGITYDNAQINAVKIAGVSKFSVMIGGPGTGKGTVMKAIIDLFRQTGKKVLLAAPTGLAAGSVSGATGMKAQPIHRLLKNKSSEVNGKDADNTLEGDVLILDEASMIDILLMHRILTAVPDNMTVLLAGDIGQLPPAGAGNALRDVIDSGVVPVVRLTRIFRQALRSKIITNAYKINKGKMPDLSGGSKSDFFFKQKKDVGEIAHEIVQLCVKYLPARYGVNSATDIQVLTPMQRGETGSVNMNKVLQAALNKNTLSMRYGTTEYRLGDRVMQTKDNYQKGVCTGDRGSICAVNTEDKILTVNFSGNHIEYEAQYLDELVLAYAVTVHESHGGKFPVIVMPFTFSHYAMLQRNLLYTGITRAQKSFVLVGDVEAISYAVENNRSDKRATLLCGRMREAFLMGCSVEI